MHERQEGDHSEQPEWSAKQANPAAWTGGEQFSAILHEEQKDGKTRFSVQVFDGRERVIIDFTNSVRTYRTAFFAPDASPTPPLSEPQEVIAQTTQSEGTTSLKKETVNKPVKIEGTIRKIDELRKTKKKQQPMLFFTVYDETNSTERRAIAFDSIAERLASPETHLQSHEPITLFAWRHENTVHLQGKEIKVEDWYVQKAVYQGNLYEKPKPAGKKGTEHRR